MTDLEIPQPAVRVEVSRVIQLTSHGVKIMAFRGPDNVQLNPYLTNGLSLSFGRVQFHF